MSDLVGRLRLSHKSRAALQYVAPASLLYFSAAVALLVGPKLTPTDLAGKVGGFAVVAICAALVQDLIPKPIKEALIFWRFKYRLPGHRAFMPEFDKPSLYDIRRIKNISDLCVLPPEKQQRLFYKTYKKHSREPQIEHCSYRYIAWRDTASALLLLVLITPPVSIVVFGRPALTHTLILTSMGFIAFLVSAVAARGMASELIRLIWTVETMGRPHALSE